MTVVKYTLKDGTVKKFAMELPLNIPFMWTKRNTNQLLDSPPGYPKHYTQKLLDWWHNGGRGNYLNKNGAWVASDGSANSLPPPADGLVLNPPVNPPTPTRNRVCPTFYIGFMMLWNYSYVNTVYYMADLQNL